MASSSESSELASILSRRQQRNDRLANGEQVQPEQKARVGTNVYIEFQEFSRKKIKEYEDKFKRFNASGNGRLSLEELKVMMERLGAPQTHLSLKNMIKEADEDGDGCISFREFLLIFRKSQSGQLMAGSGLSSLAEQLEVDVDEVGVGGAKSFFEAKIAEANKTNQFEDDLRQEKEEKQKCEEEKRLRQQKFKEKAKLFGN